LKPQLVQDKGKKKIVEEQFRKPSLEIITKEQFINEARSMH
jgi:hypothetical protein